MEKIERINKYLSESGVCSRREVDTLIGDGRVEVNGQPAHIGMQIDTEHDVVTVDGQKVDPSNPYKNAISQEALDPKTASQDAKPQKQTSSQEGQERYGWRTARAEEQCRGDGDGRGPAEKSR